MTTHNRRRVLIADDSPTIRRLLRHFLAADHQVIGEASNGYEAVNLAEELRPDVVLMDLNMPSMGGMEAIRVLGQRVPEARVIVASVADKWETLRECMTLGARHYLTKPFEEHSVLAAIDEVFQREAEQVEARSRNRPSGAGTWAFAAPGTGDGRTTLMLGMGEQLRSLGHRVLVADLNLMFPDAGLYLDTTPQSQGLHHLLQEATPLEPQTYRPYIRSIRDRLDFLEAGVPADEAYLFPWDAAADLLTALERDYDYILVDFPPGLPEGILPILDRSRYVFPVSTLGPETLKNLRRLVELMKEVGYSRDKIRPLVVSDEEVVDLTWLRRSQLEADRILPYDRSSARRALNEGVPVTALAEAGPLARALVTYVQELLRAPVVTATSPHSAVAA